MTADLHPGAGPFTGGSGRLQRLACSRSALKRLLGGLAALWIARSLWHAGNKKNFIRGGPGAGRVPQHDSPSVPLPAQAGGQVLAAAAMLGIDSQTVRSTHHKALVKLRKYFAEDEH